MNKFESKKRWNLVIVTTEPFPIGMAATNRIISWARVLCNNGVAVKVYVTKPTEKGIEIFNKEYKGIYENIHFEYVNKTTIWPVNNSKLIKFLIILKGYFILIVKLVKERPESIVTYTSSFNIKVSLLFLRLFIKFNLIAEETEYPRCLKVKHNWISKNVHLSIFKFFDGVLVITKELYDYYSSLRVRNIFVLPMSVYSNRFNYEIKNNTLRYFAYVGGSGGFVRDGVFDIIKGFKIFLKEFPDYKLLIIGPIDTSGVVFKSVYKYIIENEIVSQVEFSGIKPSYQIPEILANATGLILAPPNNFSSGGFPTKLGEYLASGTPVICTKVSDIPLYLNSNNSYLVDPGDVQMIANSMKSIILDPVNSEKIGLRGKLLVDTVFNAETYFEEFKEFLKLKVLP